MLPLCILIRIVSNPLSNVFQKVLTRRGVAPLAVICGTHLLLSIICTPLLPLLPAVRAGFWPNVVLCAALAVAANTLLVEAVRRTDLSVLGPVNAYKALVSLIPGMLLLREFPGPLGAAGMALIVLGSYALVDRDPRHPDANPFVRFFNDRGVQFRLAALVLSAVEAVFLKRALLASTPLTTFVYWSLLGLPLSLIPLLLLSKGGGDPATRPPVASILPTLGLTALLTGLMQLTTLVTFASVQVGYSLALFQTSSLLTVVLGHKVFNERHVVRRLIGSAVMVAGAVLIVVSR